jgi:hypothetical protein
MSISRRTSCVHSIVELLEPRVQFSVIAGNDLIDPLDTPTSAGDGGTLDAKPGPVTVYAPNATVAGASIGEWTARWWQWAAAIPGAQNPVLDNGPAELNQSGPVFYLAGSGSTAPVERQAHIPAGTNILFPFVNFIDTNFPDFPWVGNITEERALVAGVLDTTSQLSFTIDGQTPQTSAQLFTHREVDPFANGFLVDYPEDNAFFPGFGIPAGSYQSITDGYWLMLGPLSNGNHRLHFTARVDFGDTDPSNDFTQDVTYQVQVVGQSPSLNSGTGGTGTNFALPTSGTQISPDDLLNSPNDVADWVM